jgi:hypothetical protein
MARGWESKDVESQQDLAEQRERDRQRTRLTQDELELQGKRESLHLDRTRLLHDLASARHPRHAEMIRQALNHIESKLAALQPTLK